MATDPTDRACALHERGMALRDAGRPAAAIRACARALALFEQHSGRRHPDVANVLVELAGAAHDLGRYEDALAHARRALGILKPLRGEVDFERIRASAHAQMGHTFVAQGKYARAEKACLAALAVARAELPADEVPTFSNGLAIVYKYLARYADASRLYKDALRRTERARGPRHPALASILHNLGGLEHARGRFARAEPYARRGLAIRKSSVERGHPDIAADEAALAAILHGMARFREAERLFRGAIRLFERTLGKQHFEVGFNLGNLAALCQAEGRLAEAERLYRRSLAIKTRALGPEHPDVALTIQNLATLRHSFGRHAEAAKLARQALGIFRKTVGARHPQTRACAVVLRTLENI
jgi:tetratricopeptide (TPR) repeat protein